MAADVGHADDGNTRLVSRAYLALTGDNTVLRIECGTGYGGTCVDLAGDEQAAAIVLLDDTAQQPVSGVYRFFDDAQAELAAGGFCDSVSVAVPAGAVELQVLVKALDPVGCGDAGVARSGTGTVNVTFDLSGGDPFLAGHPEPQDCLEAVPDLLGLAGSADAGEPVTLDVLVLLDGVSTERGRVVFDAMARAYAPLDTSVSPRFRPVTFTTANAKGMIGQAREVVGGEVPPGVDVVYAITNKQLNANMAECIGGVRYADRSFAVAMDAADRPFRYLPGVEGSFIHDYAAKIAAHEIGHLLGGHHHYGDCSSETTIAGETVDSCTVMVSPSPYPTALQLSTLNGAIVRRHAVEHAVP